MILNSFHDFGLVYPYEDFFYNKQLRTSTHKGNLWDEQEFANLVIRDERMQHVSPLPDLSQHHKLIYLLGDSIVESVAEPLDHIFYRLSNNRNSDLNIVAQHFAGCSLTTLAILLNNYRDYFTQNSIAYKPDYTVIQLRRYSYRGGNTNFWDPVKNQMVDYQEKLPIDESLAAVVKWKKNFLALFKLDVKFSSKPLDKFFRSQVLGKIHVFSLLAWRIYNWSISSSQYPNQEKFFTTKISLEDMYWDRFENEIRLLLQVSKKVNIPISFLLIPDPELFKHYQYAQTYDATAKHYIELFKKYSIPYQYALEDFYQVSKENPETVFWNDGHPSHRGAEAMSRSLDKLLGGIIK